MHQGNALNTALPMVICFFVGCMCAPCFKRRRTPQKTPQFREPIGNSMILCHAIRELFPSWSLANDQALRSWILSMPASIRGRLDLLPEEYLRQFCAAPPPLPSVASVRTQTIRLCMPHAPRATLSASTDKEAVSAAQPPTAPAGAEAAARPPRPSVRLLPHSLLRFPPQRQLRQQPQGARWCKLHPASPCSLRFCRSGSLSGPLRSQRHRNLCSSCCLVRLCRLARSRCCRPCPLGPPLFLLLSPWSRTRRTSCWRRRLTLLSCRAR